MLGRLLRSNARVATPPWLGALPAALADGLYALDHRFRFTFVNQAAERHWGCAASALLHRPIWEMFPALTGGRLHDAHLGALRDRKTVAFTGPSGVDDKWVEGNAHPHSGGLLVLFRDITEHRRRAAALHECRARLTALFDRSGIGMAEGNSTGNIKRVNARFCRCFGRAADELVGTSMAALLPGWAAWLRRAQDGAEGSETEFQFTRSDGTVSWLNASLSLTRDGEGNPHTTLLVVHDLSHRRAAEQALRSLNASLEARVSEALAERAGVEESLRQSQKMEALGQLAGGVAHDFNNILQAINGGARLIRRKPADAESVERLAGLIVDAADRGAAVTRRLLSFARRDALLAEPVEVGPMLADLADVLAHTLGRRVAVRAVSEHRLLTFADRGQLETALVNLATNARDAMPEGGTLTLEAVGESVTADTPHRAGLQPGDYVRFTAADTGAGMDDATLAHATEPFFTTKPRGKGTGLGLSMSRGFAEQSGGALLLSSTPGHGTTVEIWLPVAASSAPSGPAVDAPPARLRVLLVDDDLHVREVLAEELCSLGCEVFAHSNASAALAWLDAGNPADILVSDLSMPGTDGLTTIREAQTRRAGLPAILLTGYAGDALEAAVGNTFSGPVTLLRKPVRSADLAAALGGLLRTTAS